MAGRYRMQDDSVTVAGAGPVQQVGKQVTERGENLRREKIEAGMADVYSSGEKRPRGKASARMSCGVNPLDPIDSRMPGLHPS